MTIEFETRENGVMPENLVCSSEEAREKCPKLLVEFYESRIN